MSLQTNLMLKLGDDYKQFLIQNKDNDNYFIIDFGPPASGKSGMKKEIITFLQNKFTDIDVDTIVKNICIKRLLDFDCNNIDQKTYFKLRKEADVESNDLLISSVVNKQNVIWETTGVNLSWIMYCLYFMKELHYKIIIAIPIAHLDQIIDRCKLRIQAADCSFEYLSSLRSKSYENFPIIANVCDRVLIFDNDKKLHLIYDSIDQYCNDSNRLIVSDDIQTPLHEYFNKKCLKDLK